jgi:hypothetical protein
MGELKHHSKVVLIVIMIMNIASADVSVTVDFATAYTFRGSTLDSFVIQPGIEASGFGVLEEYGSVLAGTWGNFDLGDNEETADSSEFSEIDWYAYYTLPPLIEDWYLFVGYIEYTYPNTERLADKEANAGIRYEIADVELGVTVYYGIGGDITGDTYYSLSALYSTTINKQLDFLTEVLIGYYDPEAGAAGWNDGTADVGITYWINEVWSIGASLAYITELGDTVYDNADVIGMLSFGAYF